MAREFGGVTSVSVILPRDEGECVKSVWGWRCIVEVW